MADKSDKEKFDDLEEQEGEVLPKREVMTILPIEDGGSGLRLPPLDAAPSEDPPELADPNV